MKGSVLTTRTWLLLATAVLLFVAGAMNFWQRSHNQGPPTDGVTWVDASQGIVAKSIAPGSAAARARMNPGDRLLAISMTEQKCEDLTRGVKCDPVVEAKHVQILDPARDRAHHRLPASSQPTPMQEPSSL